MTTSVSAIWVRLQTDRCNLMHEGNITGKIGHRRCPLSYPRQKATAVIFDNRSTSHALEFHHIIGLAGRLRFHWKRTISPKIYYLLQRLHSPPGTAIIPYLGGRNGQSVSLRWVAVDFKTAMDPPFSISARYGNRLQIRILKQQRIPTIPVSTELIFVVGV